MTRGWARTLALSLVPLLASVGCDALTVRPFAGTVAQLTLDPGGTNLLTAIPPTQHLELWARTQYNDIVRLAGFIDQNTGTTAYGIMIRQAISLNDPCMIDANGNLLTTAAAYKPSNAGGVMQSPQDQAQQVIDRINQLTVAPGSSGPLLAILPYDPTPVPSIPPNVSADQRKAICTSMYTDVSATTYVGNPYQITGPLHGIVYGFAKFISSTPPTEYDGYRIDMPINLKGVQEIFFTLEGANVDPKNRGPLFLTSTTTQGGRDVVHFELSSPTGGPSGSASLLVNLDQDPVQF